MFPSRGTQLSKFDRLLATIALRRADAFAKILLGGSQQPVHVSWVGELLRCFVHVAVFGQRTALRQSRRTTAVTGPRVEIDLTNNPVAAPVDRVVRHSDASGRSNKIAESHVAA